MSDINISEFFEPREGFKGDFCSQPFSLAKPNEYFLGLTSSRIGILPFQNYMRALLYLIEELIVSTGDDDKIKLLEEVLMKDFGKDEKEVKGIVREKGSKLRGILEGNRREALEENLRDEILKYTLSWKEPNDTYETLRNRVMIFPRSELPRIPDSESFYIYLAENPNSGWIMCEFRLELSKRHRIIGVDRDNREIIRDDRIGLVKFFPEKEVFSTLDLYARIEPKDQKNVPTEILVRDTSRFLLCRLNTPKKVLDNVPDGTEIQNSEILYGTVSKALINQ